MLVGAMNPCPVRLPRRRRARVPLHAAAGRRAIAIGCRVRCAIGSISPSRFRRFRPTRWQSVDGGESSAAVRARVVATRARQRERYATDGLRTNAELTPALMRNHCCVDPAGARAESAVKHLALSARGYDRVRKVARTIADLVEAPSIAADHVAEALQFRMAD